MARLKMLGPNVRVMDTRIAKPAEKRAKPIYRTPEYREWQAQVIAAAHGRCQNPHCGRSNCTLYADHIVEIEDGGAPFDMSNGQALCARCHGRKTEEERRKRHVAPPQKARAEGHERKDPTPTEIPGDPRHG